MSGTAGANLPVRIEVQGTQQAEAQFNRVGQAGQAAMQRVTQSTNEAGASTGRFSQVVGQAGFQVGDFASQVQAGQSAMTALAQQGSQFLGVFGTAGAVAGAALTVGILAAQLFGLTSAAEAAEDASKRLADAEKAYQDALRTTIELTETAEQRTARLLRERVDSAQIGFIEQRNQLEGLRFFVNREIEEARRAAQAPVAVDPFGAGREFIQGNPSQETLIQGYLAQLDAIAEALGRVDDAQRRLNRAGGDLGQGQFGPFLPTPERPSRAPRDTFEDDFDRFIRATETPLAQYERRIREISALEEEARSRGNPIPAENIQRAVDAALADFERLQLGTKRMGDESQRTSDFARQLGLSFSSAFEDAIVRGEGLSNVLKGLEQDIARIIIRTAVTTPLANAIGAAINPFQTSLTNYVQGNIGSIDAMQSVGKAPGQSLSVSLSSMPARAMGGPVFPGETYLVGERGPELLTMGRGGYVTPNLGGPSISQTFNIDARGADASMVPRLRAEMVAIARASNAELLDSIQRGGSAARIVGRRA